MRCEFRVRCRQYGLRQPRRVPISSVLHITGAFASQQRLDRLDEELGESGQAVLTDGFGREQRDHGYPVGQ